MKIKYLYIGIIILLVGTTELKAQKHASATPSAAFTLSNTTLCQGDSIFFLNQSTTSSGAALNTVHWYFGDGSDSRVENPVHKYSSFGSFTVSLVAYTTVSGSAEIDSISNTLVVNEIPSITFSYLGGGTNLNNDTSFLQGGSLTISVTENYPTYIWIPTGETSNSISVKQSGTFTVFVVDTKGCKNQKSQIVVVSALTQGDSASIKIENNLLTLNNDGVNDYFIIKDFDKYNFPIEISIFNLWGDLIYHNTDYQNDWDGTYNAKPLDAGTYYYVLRSENRKGDMGFIDILR